MFGFTPLATTTLASSQAGISADIIVPGVSASGAINNVTIHVSTVLTGVSCVGTISSIAIDGFEIGLSERLNSVSATGTVNTITVNISEKISSVTSTGIATGGTYSGKASTILTGVSATGYTEPVSAGGFEIDISENLLSVVAVGQVSGITVNIVERVDSVTATGIVNSVGVSSTVTSGSVYATGYVNNVVEHIVERLVSVGSIASIGVVSYRLSATVIPITPAMILHYGVPIATGILFDYESIKDSYDRSRTIYLNAEQTNQVVVIMPGQSTTIYLNAQDRNTTVKIAA